MPMKWGVLQNRCWEKLMWRSTRRFCSWQHILTVNVKVNFWQKIKTKVVQEKERKKNQNTQWLAGRSSDSFQTSLLRCREMCLQCRQEKWRWWQWLIFCHAFFPARYFYYHHTQTNILLLLFPHQHILDYFCWLEYVNQVQMKHIHWLFNFCTHLQLPNVYQIFKLLQCTLLGTMFGFLGYKHESTKQEARKAEGDSHNSLLPTRTGHNNTINIYRCKATRTTIWEQQHENTTWKILPQRL